MKKFFLVLALVGGLHVAAFSHPGIWLKADNKTVVTQGERVLFPAKYQVYSLNAGYLKSVLNNVSTDLAYPAVIELPMGDGTIRSFNVWQTPVMPAALAERYPAIKTFTAVGVDNKSITAKIDITYAGFHAMITEGNVVSMIDPYSRSEDGYYLSYYKHEYGQVNESRMVCEVRDADEDELHRSRLSVTGTGIPGVQLKTNGILKRTYRLALAATIEYSAAVAGSSPTKAAVLSAMVTSINRINGVYEREISVTMELVADNDQLIYLSGTDPYTNSNGTLMQSENQTNIDNIIGTSKYDIGHVFSTGGGGVAEVACVCNNSVKARGVTGRSKPVGDPFDLDYVAHEIGHQFGAMHTFNATTGSCGGAGNLQIASSYEPGSGSTLMAYAGICGINNIQSNTSVYFHARSLQQMSDFMSDPFGGGLCPLTATSGNTPAVIPAFNKEYYIPYKTPFEITAPEAIDSDHDELTYCWEQYNLGDFGVDFVNTQLRGPIFRSFDPTGSRTRIFPTLEKLLNNETNYLGEKLPEVARRLAFRLTVRDIKAGLGIFSFPDDSVVLNVINTGAPFAVSAPNTKEDYWQIGSNVTITWDVANTTAAPVSCTNVDILLSLDNGHTYPHVLVANTPNDGTETITVPNAPTASARVKVKAVDNVFFDISNAQFIINNWPASVGGTPSVSGISIYPVPATDVVYIKLNDNNTYTATITNAIGQQLYHAGISGEATLSVKNWPSGIYYVQLVSGTGERMNKTLVVK